MLSRHCLNSFASFLESIQFHNKTPQRLTRQCWHISVAGILQQVDEIGDTVSSGRCNDAELPEMAWLGLDLRQLAKQLLSRAELTVSALAKLGFGVSEPPPIIGRQNRGKGMALRFSVVNRLGQDDLVEKVRPKPEGDAAIRLAGFLGRSSNADHWRVYLSQDLDDHLEVAESDILHSMSLRGPATEFGGSILWVKPDAKVKYSPPQTHESPQIEEEFLKGDLIARNLPPLRLTDLVAEKKFGPWRSDVVPSGIVCVGVTIIFEC